MEWKQREEKLVAQIEETENAIRAQQVVLDEVSPKVAAAQQELRIVLDEQQREEKKMGEYQTLLANLKNELGHGRQFNQPPDPDDKDFSGCPKEWQRDVIVFMRKQPGVPIHFTALITHVSQKMDEFDGFTKMRAAMLNLMGHLITRKLVAKGKTGQYSWAVYPEGWKTAAPVIPIAKKSNDLERERIANKFVDGLIAGGEFFQKELEKLFHKKCIEKGISTDASFKDDAQFIEKWIYDRAQEGTGILAVYELDPKSRKTDEVSTHLVMSRVRNHPGPQWVLIKNPATRQPPIDTKRKGGSVA